MMKRSLLVVALGIAHLNLALGGTARAAAGFTPPPPSAPRVPLTFPLPHAGGFIPSLDEMLSVRTRDLLAKKWRKAKIEKSVAYEGKPIDVRLMHDPNEYSVHVLSPFRMRAYLPSRPHIGASAHRRIHSWACPLTHTPSSRHTRYFGGSNRRTRAGSSAKRTKTAPVSHTLLESGRSVSCTAAGISR